MTMRTRRWCLCMLLAGALVACGRKEQETKPVVPVQVAPVEQRRNRTALIAFERDLDLAEHGRVAMLHQRDQMTRMPIASNPTHGFAINVHNELEPFSLIVACGLPGVAMTSLQRELPSGRRLDPARFRERVADCFCAVHGRRARAVAASALRGPRAAPRPPAPTRGRMPRASRRGAITARADATLKSAIGPSELPVAGPGAGA